MKSRFILNLGNREKAFKEGDALYSHMKACHNGEFDPECPACQELKTRMEEEIDKDKGSSEQP